MKRQTMRSMESVLGKRTLLIVLLICVVIVKLRGEENESNEAQHNVVAPSKNVDNVGQSNRDQNEVVLDNKRSNSGGRGGGGGGGGGNGGGGGGGGYGYGWGWGGRGGGGGGGGGGGCKKQPRKRGGHYVKKRGKENEEYKVGEYGECMVRGRCKGMRLDCPLHCGGPCLYDCTHMCKPHCKS